MISFVGKAEHGEKGQQRYGNIVKIYSNMTSLGQKTDPKKGRTRYKNYGKNRRHSQMAMIGVS